MGRFGIRPPHGPGHRTVESHPGDVHAWLDEPTGARRIIGARGTEQLLLSLRFVAPDSLSASPGIK